MTKSEAAFVFSAERLFEENPRLYFWTFTFKEAQPDWWYAQTWSRFIKELSDLYGGQLRGLKVTELHKDHGIHYHALLNKRIAVDLVRKIGRRYGVGRVHVVQADHGAVGYLAKYLTKQCKETHRIFGGGSRWGTVGGFRGCRVRDVQCDSPFHRRVKLAQETCGLKKLPFLFVCGLFRHDLTEEQVVASSRRFLATGSISGMTCRGNAVQYNPVACSRNREAVRQ